jgi:sRNA-binding protein
MRPKQVIQMLAERYPLCFHVDIWTVHHPIAIGIHTEILKDIDIVGWELRDAMRSYTQRIMYLRAMVPGAARIDLFGNAVGCVDDAQAQYAAVRLQNILQKRERKSIEAAAVRVSQAEPTVHELEVLIQNREQEAQDARLYTRVCKVANTKVPAEIVQNEPPAPAKAEQQAAEPEFYINRSIHRSEMERTKNRAGKDEIREAPVRLSLSDLKRSALQRKKGL